MKFVTIVAAFTACAILTLGVIGGQSAVGTPADAQIRDRMVAPVELMRDAREVPVETVDDAV